MIKVHKETDFSSKKDLLRASVTHIKDVGNALAFFSGMLAQAAAAHDYDKLSDIDRFYRDFESDFESTEWWDDHRKLHRHHLAQEDGIPDDVNLVDVIEYISDCVMAGSARSGDVYDLKVLPGLLERAFTNTVELLKSEVEVVDPAADLEAYCAEANLLNGLALDCYARFRSRQPEAGPFMIPWLRGYKGTTFKTDAEGSMDRAAWLAGRVFKLTVDGADTP